MADEEKTEQATPKKRQEAREKGQVAKSIELNTAFLLLFAIIFFYFNIAKIGGHLFDVFTYFINLSSNYEFTINSTSRLLKDVTYIMFTILLPFFGLMAIVAFIVNIAQVGFMVTPKAIELKFDKLNPINGFKNMFSLRSFGELIKSVLKAIIVFYILYIFIKDKMPFWFDFIDTPVKSIFIELIRSIFFISIYVLIFVVFMSILDYLFQRYSFEKSIRMSHKEIKDEYKQMEGDPHVKQKIRKMQMEMAKKRMMEDVKKADVVITNPTHYAVALKYNEYEMNAPKVIAKGMNLIAQKIKEIAKENDVDIVEKPEIARELYKRTKIGDEIPEELYRVVAEILAYVYKAKKERNA